MPDDLLRALEEGEVTQEQLRALISLEAEELGMTFDDVVEAAKAYTLPKNALGTDLEFLIQLLQKEPSAA